MDMRKFDVYWKSNKEWYFYDGLVPKLKEDAPEEAKKSFEHYLQQKRVCTQALISVELSDK